jgi:hypothetical protein
MNHRFVVSLFALVGAAVIACSSSDDTAPGGGSSSSSSSSSSSGSTGAATTRVTAAAGGTVTDPGGKLALNIPAGALAADTDITLAVKPAESGSAGEVYEFGPDGLQFTKPVALSIKSAGVTVPEGKSLAIGLFDGTTFKALEGSTSDGTNATASIMHFSRYSLVVVDGKIVINPPAGCEDLRTKFQPCGGDLTGTWTFTEFCIDLPTPGSGPNCPDLKAEGDIDLVRDGTFDGAKLTLSAGTLTQKGTIHYPRSCLSNATCAQVQDGLYKNKPGGTCVDEGTDKCLCQNPPETSNIPAEEQTYTVSGNTITITKKDGTTSVSDYCVSGDTVVSREPDKDGKRGGMFMLKRKTN